MARDDEEEEEDSDEEDSDEVNWNEVQYSDREEEDALNDSVCPPGCEPELFEHALQQRERRLDLEDLLMEEKEAAEVLRKECDTLKKEKMLKSKRKAAENDLDMITREIQEKMNKLDILVPVKLHQVHYLA
ncbi:cilia- and flagella-associated protein 44-like [Gouania willdenowi]|uniref:cilia- and flagella-associated protein 44-like n=1 Tax=Gouania willdenowi TaxID=441366 RepID=UPI001054A44B|nr:cilia- and flagella-associated protein 44-like [Gouania willdenowi]